MSANKSKAAAPSASSTSDSSSSGTLNRKKPVLYSVAGILLLTLLALGVMGKQGWLPATDALSGKKTGWFGTELPQNAASSRNPLAAPAAAAVAPLPSGTPQLSKEYIYAGSRMLAVEDANANAAPPADLAVWRPSSGAWYVMGGPGSQQTITGFGANGDKPMPGDYDGDGKTDFAVVRSAADGNYTWYFNPTTSITSYYAIQFGMTGDLPAVADFDGDGKSDPTIFRPSNGSWYIFRSTDSSIQTIQFGANGDTPVPADFDGDGKSDPAIWRVENGQGKFYFLQSSLPNTYRTFDMGAPGDVPVAGDVDGDGKNDLIIYRPSGSVSPATGSSRWYFITSASNYSSYSSLDWGQAGDVLVPNDYDGDRKTDLAIWRPSNGNWYIRQSSKAGTGGELRQVGWGQAGDIPVPAFYRR